MVPAASPDAGFQRGPLDRDDAGSVPMRSYDVFLNHRGPDVKTTFVSHLSTALNKVNFCSFVDHREIHPGDLAWETIKSAINHSKIHIAVFSKRYAESVWCLDELRLIMECFHEKRTELFLPVFFHVKPSDLRLQTPSRTSCYDSALEALVEKYEDTVITVWKKALHDAADVKGYIFSDEFEGSEARLVERIVSKVIEVLSRATLLHGPEHPVGVDEKLHEALEKMQRIKKLGIYGMGGVGKSTLAKSIYNRIHREFDCACFLQEVSGGIKDANKELKVLQEGMLKELLKTPDISVLNTASGKRMMRERLEGKKVLIILDDVREKEQLDELMPPYDCYLGLGSKIVITTRDQQVLMWAAVNVYLPMEELSRPLACKLFNLHAFHLQEEPSRARRKESSKDFKELAEKVADACQGLPLALEVIGSYLRGKGISEWEATMKGLETSIKPVDAQRQVRAILKISFDALRSAEEKHMFLDIACFLFQDPKDKGMQIWRSEHDDAAAEHHLENLIRKCLVKIDKNGQLTMHDLLRDMGREIVENSHKDYWKRSHLWKDDEVSSVLQKRKGTSHVRGLSSNVPKEWETTSFAGMDELKLLVLSNVTLTGRDFSKIPQELRWFQLRNCPLRTLSLDKICLDKVAVLDLEGSKLTSFNCADGMLKNLKALNLSNCANLKELTVKFSKSSTRLESLILNGCENLERMPRSVSDLSSSLRYLDISGCSKLTTLPRGITNLRALTTLLMNNCGGFTTLPREIGQLTALEKIGLDRVPLISLPRSFYSLSNLVSLRLDHFRNLTGLPSTIGNFRKLTSLDIISCPHISEIPPEVRELHNLVRLQVSHCESVVSLPSSINGLYNLEVLNLKGCSNLCEVQHFPRSLRSLDVGGCTSLKYLDMSWCSKLKTLPDGIESLRSLTTLLMNNCTGLTMVSDVIGQLTALQEIGLGSVSLGSLPESFSYLSNLLSLRLYGCSELMRLPLTIGNLKKLTSLEIISCPLISEIPQGVTSLTNLVHFRVSGCRSINELPENIWNLRNLKEFHVSGVNIKLSLSRISQLQHLVNLKLEGCDLGDDGLPTRGYSALSSLKRITLAEISMSSLPRDFGNLPKLEGLILMGCHNLSEVSCLPATLTSFNSAACPNLKRISVSCLFSLTKLELCNCTQLIELNGLECLGLLSHLDITGCSSLVDLPSDQLEKLTSLKYLFLAGSGVSIVQDSGSPWIQKMASLEVVTIMADEVPDYFLKQSQLEDLYWINKRKHSRIMEINLLKREIECRGVLCCFVSNERFYGNLLEERKGDTWVRANVVGKKGEGRKFSQHLFYNRISGWQNQLHVGIYRASHPFVASLKGANGIQVIAESVYDLWSIAVNEGVLKLMYGENEMEETLQKLSFINTTGH